MTDALVIGGGPSGLMAAETLARAGRVVMLAEARPTVGRKFLMAGKSGLNLAMDAPLDAVLVAYPEGAARLDPILRSFGPDAVQDWARGLGQEVFTGSTGRVFPRAMKASPLLRAWMVRLAEMGVVINTRWRWTGWQGAGFGFDTLDGPTVITPKTCVLALGGASWARLGSDAAWVPWLEDRGVAVTPFQASNVGICVDWSAPMKRVFSAPVKGVELRAGDMRSRGELVISERGLEGGGIYTISAALRDGADLRIDLLPGRSVDDVTARLARPKGKASIGNHLRKTLKLDPAKLALLLEFARPLPQGRALAERVKALPIPHSGLRPMDEAISTAGGVAWDGIDENLMLTAHPGTFVAGEMLDWDAPTGGYLINACLATGRWAGHHAAQF